VFLRGDHPAGKIGLFKGGAVGFNAPLLCLPGRFFKPGSGRGFAENLANLEKTNQSVVQADGHGAVGETQSANRCLRSGGVRPAKSRLGLQTGRAGTAFLGHQGAEGVFMAPAVVGQLPSLRRLERQRQAGEMAEGAGVILIEARFDHRLQQRAVADINCRPVRTAVGGGLPGNNGLHKDKLR